MLYERTVSGTGRAYTKQEDAVIRTHAGKKPAREIAEALARAPYSVKKRAAKLGLSLRLRGNACPWTKVPDETVEHMRAMHDAGARPIDISRSMGVPYWNVCDAVYYKRA